MNSADKKEVFGMLMGDVLSRPIKKHTKDCQCNSCLVSIKRRAQREANIKKREGK